jgi:glycosyltransferase involved in cell wall biosynthesis
LNGRRPNNEDAADASPTSLRLIFLGNLTRRKGAYDLIAAVETAAKRGVQAVLSLAGGEVEPGQRAEIKRRIAESPCASQIRLLGLVHGEEKQRALRESECVVLPSYAEGLPMALLEGMAEELPAIATHVGSIPAIVDDGAEGFLVPAGDVDALADRICRLASDPALRQSMGRRARERVERDFSQTAMARRVFQIYQAALNRKTRSTNEDDLPAAAIRD